MESIEDSLRTIANSDPYRAINWDEFHRLFQLARVPFQTSGTSETITITGVQNNERE